jgi:arginine exporter protein ArgO
MFWKNEDRILNASKDEIERVVNEVVEESKREKINAVHFDDKISSFQNPQHFNGKFFFMGNSGIAIGSSIDGIFQHFTMFVSFVHFILYDVVV